MCHCPVQTVKGQDCTVHWASTHSQTDGRRGSFDHRDLPVPVPLIRLDFFHVSGPQTARTESVRSGSRGDCAAHRCFSTVTTTGEATTSTTHPPRTDLLCKTRVQMAVCSSSMATDNLYGSAHAIVQGAVQQNL